MKTGRPRSKHLQQEPSEPEDVLAGDILLEIIPQIKNGADIDNIALRYGIPKEQLIERIVQRDRTILFEEQLTLRPTFSIPFSIEKYRCIGFTPRLTLQQLIDFLRKHALKITINDFNGNIYFEGEPITKDQLLYWANEIRDRTQLPPIRLIGELA